MEERAAKDLDGGEAKLNVLFLLDVGAGDADGATGLWPAVDDHGSARCGNAGGSGGESECDGSSVHFQ